MSRKYVVQEGSGSWRMRLRDVDWEKFWLAEMLILAIPMMVAVFSTGGRSPVRPHALEIVLVVQVSLTLVNLFLCIPGGSSDRGPSPKKHRSV
jgi:uncharacterized membrane protein YhaH (DUF805 family)